MINRLFKDTCQVQTLIGPAGDGDAFADPFPGKCHITDGNKLVRDQSGNEVVSSTTLHVPTADVARYAVGSKVTANSRTSFVIGTHRRDNIGSAGMRHVRVDLT